MGKSLFFVEFVLLVDQNYEKNSFDSFKFQSHFCTSWNSLSVPLRTTLGWVDKHTHRFTSELEVPIVREMSDGWALCFCTDYSWVSAKMKRGHWYQWVGTDKPPVSTARCLIICNTSAQTGQKSLLAWVVTSLNPCCAKQNVNVGELVFYIGPPFCNSGSRVQLKWMSTNKVALSVQKKLQNYQWRIRDFPEGTSVSKLGMPNY